MLSSYLTNFVCLGVVYYFSTKRILGPIMGMIYAIYGIVMGIIVSNGITFISYLILCVGYVLLLIYDND